MQIFMIGLDGSGKTTLLSKLKMNEITSRIATTGFNVERIEYNNTTLIFWDIDVLDKERLNWESYLNQNFTAVVFVIDSNDRDRINIAKEELEKLMNEERLKGILFLILANKQDSADAMKVSEIVDRLGLLKVKERKWFVQGTSVINGVGINEGLERLLGA